MIGQLPSLSMVYPIGWKNKQVVTRLKNQSSAWIPHHWIAQDLLYPMQLMAFTLNRTCSYSSDGYLFCGKRPLAIAAMNMELPPFKNGVHNSEITSTFDRVITPLNIMSLHSLDLSEACCPVYDRSLI